ncbi:MAG: serine/threonine-protein kinase [Pseudomonadota bacterium]
MTNIHNDRSLPSGAMIQEYRIEGVLGSGNFGIVYRASNIYLDEIVAIKEFLPVQLAFRSDDDQVVPISSDTEEAYIWALGRFLKEAKILWELGQPEPNPNIIRVKRFHKANGTAYMVMDYEEGEPLSDLLSKHGTLPRERVESILFPLLDGLAQVHAASVLHRDIKPSNILIRPDGSPVLIDFGAARRDFGDPTGSIMAVYSPMYAPLEQVTPVGDQGPWTDIYSLGATLYHAVTGKAPAFALARGQGAGHVAAVEAASKEYSETFLKAIDAAIELAPNDRPQSIAEFRRLLGSAAPSSDGQETVILRDSANDRTVVRVPGPLKPPASAPAVETVQKPIKTNIRLWVGVAGVAFAITALGLTLFMRLSPQIAESPTEVVESRPDVVATPPEVVESKPAMTRDALMSEIQKVIQSVDCAYLNAHLSDGLILQLSGHVSGNPELKRLNDALKAIGPLKRIDLDVKVYEPPFCSLIAMLQRQKSRYAAYNDQLWIEFNKRNRRYRPGDFLVLKVTAGFAYNGYLYVDYFDKTDGLVTHMLPSPVSPDNALRAGESVELGVENKANNYLAYVIQQPGTNLIVAIYSRESLFDGLRSSEEERISDYYPVLRAALDRIPQEQKPMVAFDFITIVQ